MMLAFKLTPELRSTAAESMWDCWCRVPIVAPPGPARPPTPTPTPTRRRLGVGGVPASRRGRPARSPSRRVGRWQPLRVPVHVAMLALPVAAARQLEAALAGQPAGHCRLGHRRGSDPPRPGDFASGIFLFLRLLLVLVLTGSCLGQGLRTGSLPCELRLVATKRSSHGRLPVLKNWRRHGRPVACVRGPISEDSLLILGAQVPY
jgi:hypothetical protein